LKCYAPVAQARNINIAVEGSVVGGFCRCGGFSPARFKNVKLANLLLFLIDYDILFLT
jgi:hypothetical protein